MGVPVIDANCQRASEMQYESRAVSLFALCARARATRDSRLAARGFAASARILEQKRDCSQSKADVVFACGLKHFSEGFVMLLFT